MPSITHYNLCLAKAIASANRFRVNKISRLVLNSMNDANATFGYDTNKITIIKNDFTQTAHSLKSKKEVAKDIVDEVAILAARAAMKQAAPISSPIL